ncbi:SCO family protein [Parvularcula sp. ZS-1/3]|uniref:SCO family protein n=1 Tax=Parvularcula mediterranea TaxID=2732508 RepID=A0A7Y3RKH6_9PROT|nr:SCO family protein [Parvularcula mediterranea]NNU15749.1 SCO family protein [Parvularcula mediterranea]
MDTMKHLIAGLCAAALLASCADERPIAGEITLNEAFSAEFDLVDMYGEDATDERFEGKPMLIYFGFTSCPDVCPAALGVLTATLEEMGKDASGLQPLFITVDPERDTQARLVQHLSFDERILGLTGDEEAIEAAMKRMRVFAAKVPLEDSAVGYTVDHQSMFFLTDENGRPIRAFNDSIAPDVFAKRLKAFL